MNKPLTFLILLTLSYSDEPISSNSSSTTEPIWMESIIVNGVKTPSTTFVIDQETMTRDDVKDLWEAMHNITGVNLTSGGQRNDSSFSIRGFGSKSVPIFVDGIATTDPYHGNFDAARILTGDLESITVEKGYSSRLLGANTLGGAVMMRTAKPEEPFEGKLEVTSEYDSVYAPSLQNYVGSLGTKQDSFYLKTTAQYRNIDHFRLPDSFVPTDGNPQEVGNRMFSNSSDTKYTVIGGVTPLSELDVWATYIEQDSDKGVSPLGTETLDYVIWDWIYWKRKDISLNSVYDDGTIKISAMGYFDKYDNALNTYDSLQGYALGLNNLTSTYDDYSTGGRVGFDWKIDQSNTFQTAITYKQENHTSYEGSVESMVVSEETLSWGAEYTLNPIANLSIVGGVGYDALTPQTFTSDTDRFVKWLGASYYVIRPSSNALVSGQLGIFYQLLDNHELRFTYSRKNRFPTMKERYSTRFGVDVPNPKLQPEIADHFELGYQLNSEKIKINTSIYASYLMDKVVTILIPNPYYPTRSVNFPLNLDSVVFYGYELSGDIKLTDWFLVGANFSLNEYTLGVSSQKTAKVINYYPQVVTSTYAILRPNENLSIISRIEYVGSRYATIDATESLEPYTLGSLKVTYWFNDYLSFSAKVNNIFDALYQIRQYYPQAGRTFALSMSAQF